MITAVQPRSQGLVTIEFSKPSVDFANLMPA